MSKAFASLSLVRSMGPLSDGKRVKLLTLWALSVSIACGVHASTPTKRLTEGIIGLITGKVISFLIALIQADH